MLEKYGFENIYYIKCQKESIIFQKLTASNDSY